VLDVGPLTCGAYGRKRPLNPNDVARIEGPRSSPTAAGDGHWPRGLYEAGRSGQRKTFAPKCCDAWEMDHALPGA